jgi:hypothetical protein
MNFDNTAAFGWLQNGKIRLRIGCGTHMKKARKSTHKGSPAVRLVCPDGCVLGEWKNESEMNADVRKLKDRLILENPK